MDIISNDRLLQLFLIHLSPIWGKPPAEILEVCCESYFKCTEADAEIIIRLIRFRHISFEEFKNGNIAYERVMGKVQTHINNGNALYLYNFIIEHTLPSFVDMVEKEGERRQCINSRPEFN